MPLPRKLLASAALVAASALFLSACSAKPAENNADSDSATEIVWAIEGATLFAGHLDPQTSQMDVSAMVQRSILDSLVFQEADGTFSPWLAQSWAVSEDGTQYTFELREDVAFHDDTPFNAAAVKANFDRIMAPETASAQAAAMLGGDLYLGTEVLGEYTVAVSFAQPYAPFMQAASTANLGFYSPEVLATSSDQLKAGGPGVLVGTGPFVLTDMVAEQELTYTRNDKYKWGPNGLTAPAIETLRVSLFGESSVLAGVAKSGEADVTSQLTPGLAKTLGNDLTVAANEYPGLPYSLFLNENNGVFADPLVREAFSRAIDIDGAVEEIYSGMFPRAWSILGATTPGYDPSLAGTWPLDADLANQLLDQAGWAERGSDGVRVKDGQRLTAQWISWTPVPDDRAALANAVVSDLSAVGFDIERELLEPASYNERYGPKTFDITDWGFSGVDPDLLRPHLSSDGFQNASGVNSPDLDQLLEDGVTETDPQARAEIYAQVQQWNAQHNAIVPLYSPSLITAVGPRVAQISYDLYGRPLWVTATLK